jgi:hypothetical protein
MFCFYWKTNYTIMAVSIDNPITYGAFRDNELRFAISQAVSSPCPCCDSGGLSSAGQERKTKKPLIITKSVKIPDCYLDIAPHFSPGLVSQSPFNVFLLERKCRVGYANASICLPFLVIINSFLVFLSCVLTAN